MSSVAQKLGIKPGNAVAVDGHPVAEVLGLLGELPADVSVASRDGSPADQVMLLADGLPELARLLDDVWTQVAPGGRLWVWYRKGANNKVRAPGEGVPLHRDTLQALLAERGMDGVTLISVDETWSAMRVKRV